MCVCVWVLGWSFVVLEFTGLALIEATILWCVCVWVLGWSFVVLEFTGLALIEATILWCVCRWSFVVLEFTQLDLHSAKLSDTNSTVCNNGTMGMI